jgi:muramoyltetrapeptide carboxypeptidase LdcA involved in peptidoglycan recycling
VAGYYGGSTQVQLGPGPRVDPIHELSLRAALLTGGRLELTEPGESEDIGHDWNDPRALTEFGDREPTEPWAWSGPARSITGRTWGGCIEVVQWILTAGRFPSDPAVLDGGVLILESSEELIAATEVGRITRSLGERGILAAVDAVVVARPPTSDFTIRPTADQRRAKREEQRDTVIDVVHAYNADAVVGFGPPFGHTRPQWIVPYGGFITVDGASQRLFADYS